MFPIETDNLKVVDITGSSKHFKLTEVLTFSALCPPLLLVSQFPEKANKSRETNMKMLKLTIIDCVNYLSISCQTLKPERV